MHQVQILDGETFRSLLQEVRVHCETHRGAADWLGIIQSTFTRLLNDSSRQSMTFDTYSKIRAAFERHDPGDFSILGKALPPKPSWLEKFEESILTGECQLVRKAYDGWLDRELDRLQQRARGVFDDLWNQGEHRQRFESFLYSVTNREDLPLPEDRRIWLALLRAVEPLSATTRTWGVEWTWEEMDQAGELKVYLKNALRCERILLMRERDLKRIRLVPREYHELHDRLAELAGVGEEEYERGSPVPIEFWDDVLGKENEEEGDEA